MVFKYWIKKLILTAAIMHFRASKTFYFTFQSHNERLFSNDIIDITVAKLHIL